MAWFPIVACAIVAWPILALSVLVVTIRRPLSWRRRALAIATALCGSFIGWESWHLGPMFHVWWRQGSYLEQAHAALTNPPPPSDCGPGPIDVDRSDSPPVRVAFFWFAAHGDVDGVIYDPTGLADTKPTDWIYGARPRHMFGPWYRF